MSIQTEQRDDIFVGRFQAMASPCEILIDTTDQNLGHDLVQIAAEETWRIEAKFSRYKTDNIIHAINQANGSSVSVDQETAKLLDFAQQCFEISEGLFDITSGILRKAWVFNGSDQVPSQQQIQPLLDLIGWQKIIWKNNQLTMLPGMQIDLGGIGKEYAVDKVLLMLSQNTQAPVLVNFGGDLHASGPRHNGQAWLTGIENFSESQTEQQALQLFRGALTTSGDAFRYLLKDGIRYSHVLNPKTGWPVRDAPHAVTVAAENCIEAGILSTLALLQGEAAEDFLRQQEVKFWVSR